jgi:hypothetical protein
MLLIRRGRNILGICDRDRDAGSGLRAAGRRLLKDWELGLVAACLSLPRLGLFGNRRARGFGLWFVEARWRWTLRTQIGFVW